MQDASHAPVGPGGGPLPVGLREYLRSSAATGHALDAVTRGDLEQSFGRALDGVRLIRDDAAAHAAATLEARAFTLGNSIWFGRGEYRPETHEGRRLIAHEVAHSLQDAPHGGRVFADLVVGPSDDSAEREADSAADAAMRGERALLSTASVGSVRAVRLQRIACSASPTARPDQRIVRCPDGEYEVTLTSVPVSSRPQTQWWTKAGMNNTVIRLELGVCRGGTSVTIRPSVDLPRAVAQAIGNILSGSNALSGVTLTTGFQIQIIQSQSLTLTLEPTVTVDQSGVTGVGGEVGVQTPGGTFGARGTYDPQNRSGSLLFTFTPGTRSPTVDCRTWPPARLVFECRPITHIPGRREVPEITTQDFENRYLFFNYMQDTIAPDFQRSPARPGTTPSIDLRERIRAPTDIQELQTQGYRITSIEGFTSPEGPRGHGPNFEGNVELARRRARAALSWVQTQCPTCDMSGVTPEGRSELPLEQQGIVPEPTGRPMERGAVQGFLESDPLSPTDPAVRAEFQRLPERRQRDQVFELQRRAAIGHQRDGVVQQYVAPVSARDETGAPVGCPSEVLDEARRSFDITMFNTPSSNR